MDLFASRYLAFWLLATPAMLSATTLYSVHAIRGAAAPTQCELMPPRGGVDRWIDTMKRAQWSAKTDAVFVSGTTFIGDEGSAATQDSIADALATANVSAVGLSANDAAMEPARLHALAIRSKVPWIASNVNYVKHAAAGLRDSVTLTLSKRRVVVGALVSPNLRGLVEGAGGTFTDLKPAVEALRKAWNLSQATAPQLEVFLLDGFTREDVGTLATLVSATPVLFLGVSRPSDVGAVEWVTKNAVAMTPSPLLLNVAAFHWLRSKQSFFNDRVTEDARSSYEVLSRIAPSDRTTSVRNTLAHLQPFLPDIQSKKRRKNDFTVEMLAVADPRPATGPVSKKARAGRGSKRQ